MKALVLGTGSIGQRHIANLINCGVEVTAYSYRKSTIPENIFANVSYIDEVNSASYLGFDAVIIANRTDLHVSSVFDAIAHVKSIFIEKPLGISLCGVDDLFALANNYKTNIEAGFMLRFHPNLQWIREYLNNGELGEVMHIKASVGQFLPDWRPNSNYKDSYSSIRRYGGGVIFDLIHELDLVNWLGGDIEDICAMTRYVKLLGIETESIAQIGLQLKSGVLAQVHLDYVRPGYERHLEIVGSAGTLEWDYLTGNVILKEAKRDPVVVNRVPEGFERNWMFQAHIMHFLQRHKDPSLAPMSSLKDAIEVLKVALAAHCSAEQRRYVRPVEINSDYKIKGL